MKDGFVRVAAVTPKITVADPDANIAEIETMFDEAAGKGAKIIVFPELCITGYTCGDLFLQNTLPDSAGKALSHFVKHTEGTDALAFAGFPLRYCGKLYNTAAAVQNGELLAFIPKRFIPNYSEFYEERHFVPGPVEARNICFDGKQVPFGSRIMFDIDCVRDLSVCAEI